MKRLPFYLFRISASIAVSICVLSASFAQNQNVLKGKIINGSNLKQVDFAIVIIQEANIVGNAPAGAYAVSVQKPGTYTVQIQSQGFQTLTTTVTIEGTVVRDFTLNIEIAAKKGITIRGERDLQKISRQTLTAKEIKDIPAAFGDSISALTSLPGINRAGGDLFGPLIIRGADETMNGYYIDHIPLYKPMHFGGIHSVINSNLMSEIDVYSSAFPAQFGNAQAAVINITTVDKVEKLGGYANAGLISADALIQIPTYRTTYEDGKEKKETDGYFIASGRYGYITLFIPIIYERLMNKQLDFLPQYWDYQFKAKHEFNEHHSLTLLSYGNKDTWDVTVKDSWIEPWQDPAFVNFQFYTNDQAHSLGLYYTYKLNERFSNTLMSFGALNKTDQWLNLPRTTADWTKDVGTKSTPYIFGVKDYIKLEWWEKHATLRAGIELNYYYFKTSGKTIIPKGLAIDLNDPNSVNVVYLGETYKNKTIVSYAENKFTLGWFTVVPGIHTEYLSLTKKTIVDPRGMASVEFPTGTTLAVAGGKYSTFLQTNPMYFPSYPNAAGAEYLEPQYSIHRSASIEQKISDFTVKLEGFNNYFYNLVIQDSYIVNGEKRIASNNMKLKTYGAEISAKLSKEEEQGLWGWLSYTYNKSRSKADQIYDDPEYLYNNIWLNSYYDMPHVAKLVTGYTLGKHTLSIKFQYVSSTPYTKIIGGEHDTVFETANPGIIRVVPTYGKPNTERLNPSYRLDMRYSYKTSYKWGYVQWYIEAIGLITSKQKEYRWDYRYGYSDSNPKIVDQEREGLTFIPNFGVETRF
jgi:TonB-dependent Receptor Plug Domain